MIPEIAPPTSTPTEWSEVEWPLLLQLAGMGWQIMFGDIAPISHRAGEFPPGCPLWSPA